MSINYYIFRKCGRKEFFDFNNIPFFLIQFLLFKSFRYIKDSNYIHIYKFQTKLNKRNELKLVSQLNEEKIKLILLTTRS